MTGINAAEFEASRVTVKVIEKAFMVTASGKVLNGFDGVHLLD